MKTIDSAACSDDYIWVGKNFGEIIRRARKCRKLTQRELANVCGDISPMYVSQIESGGKVPSPKLALSLAKVLELDKRRLLKEAYLATAPLEVKELMMREEAASYGKPASERLERLARWASKLPDEDRRRVERILEDFIEALDTQNRK